MLNVHWGNDSLEAKDVFAWLILTPIFDNSIRISPMRTKHLEPKGVEKMVALGIALPEEGKEEVLSLNH